MPMVSISHFILYSNIDQCMVRTIDVFQEQVYWTGGFESVASHLKKCKAKSPPKEKGKESKSCMSRRRCRLLFKKNLQVGGLSFCPFAQNPCLCSLISSPQPILDRTNSSNRLWATLSSSVARASRQGASLEILGTNFSFPFLLPSSSSSLLCSVVKTKDVLILRCSSVLSELENVLPEQL
jgi:hypothetical protein